MRISDWSSDVCSSDLGLRLQVNTSSSDSPGDSPIATSTPSGTFWLNHWSLRAWRTPASILKRSVTRQEPLANSAVSLYSLGSSITARSEEHTYELQSLMRLSYAVFCLKK